MNRDSLRASLLALVADSIPKNAQRIDCTFFDDRPMHNAFARRVDPRPVEGRVVALTDEAIIVKTGRIAFVAVDRMLATASPAVGTKFRVTPYFRRDFSGERLDAPRQENWTDGGGKVHEMNVMVIGSRVARIPLPHKPTNPYLADLVEQLEILRTPDNLRTIANMLVDAKAENIEITDPDEEHSSDTPPEISFAITTERFAGRMAVLFDEGAMNYAVELRANGAVTKRIADVPVTGLAQVLTDLVDDGLWRRIDIAILSPGSKGKER